jgi:DNA-binding ferritin-like protein
MSDDQFTKLFKYMEKRFNEVDARFDTTADRSQVDRLQVAVDRIASRLDTDDTERAALTSQIDRHEVVLRRVTKKLGMRYGGA